MGDLAISRCPHCNGFSDHCKCCHHKDYEHPKLPPQLVIPEPEPEPELIPEPVPTPEPMPTIDIDKLKKMVVLQSQIDAIDREQEIIRRERKVADDLLEKLNSLPKMMREDNLDPPPPQHIEPQVKLQSEPHAEPEKNTNKSSLKPKKKARSEAFLRLTKPITKKKVSGKDH